MSRGLFITFEGIDGCGKSTMLKKLAAHLRAMGLDPLCTREPGGSELGRKFRALLLDSAPGSFDQRTETLFFAADRACHCAQVIEPALAAGRIVLCDRYADSTLAYQGGGRGQPLAELRALNAFAINGLHPDLTLLLDIDPALALLRRDDRRDRMEQEDMDFFRRVADGYRQLAQEEAPRIRIIDAAPGKEQVFAAVLQAVEPLLKRVQLP